MSEEFRLLPPEPLPDSLLEAEALSHEYRALRQDVTGRGTSAPAKIGEILLNLDGDRMMRAVDPLTKIQRRTRAEKEAYAAHMRAHMTPAEWQLWEEMRGWSDMGVAFEAQSLVHGWIVDFYCPMLRLVIEVDGGIHGTGAQYHRDQHKDAILRRDGYTILRVTNRDVTTGKAGPRILDLIAGMEVPDAG